VRYRREIQASTSEERRARLGIRGRERSDLPQDGGGIVKIPVRNSELRMHSLCIDGLHSVTMPGKPMSRSAKRRMGLTSVVRGEWLR
jgi:hypothetical protein